MCVYDWGEYKWVDQKGWEQGVKEGLEGGGEVHTSIHFPF